MPRPEGELSYFGKILLFFFRKFVTLVFSFFALNLLDFFKQ